MKALLVDAYDSFIFIIHQYLLTMDVETEVVRNDRVDLVQVDRNRPDFIVLGPGPGHPADARYCEILARFGGQIPILGVCLGHQAIGLYFGGTVEQAAHLMHGKRSAIEHDGKGVFAGMPMPFQATRYHSLIVARDSLSSSFEPTAVSTDDAYLMGMRCQERAIESVQFHPESVYTENGIRLLENFVASYVTKASSS